MRGVAPVAAWFAGSLLAALFLFWPIQVRHLDELADRISGPLQFVESEVEVPALVFVSSMQARPRSSWVFGHPNPRADLEDPILYVRDMGRANMRYIRLHPDRRAYRLIFRGLDPALEPLGPGHRP